MTTQKEIVAAIARVETALSAAARSRHIPDYAGFRERMTRRLVDERQVRSASLHPDPGPPTIAAITLLGSVFFVLDRVSISYALLATTATAFVFAAVSAALEPLGVPALTLPFVLVTWLFLLASPIFPRLRSVAIAAE